MSYIYEVGDIITLKKQHPCGSKEWEILRVGADFRLRASDYDRTQNYREEYKGFKEERVK